MDISKYKKTFIILGVIALVGLVAWLVIFRFATFSILSVTPSANKVSNLAPTIKILTNQTISDKPIEFDDGGTGIVASVKGSDRSVVINLYQNMVANKKYTITLKNITSVNGRVIPSYNYVFMPVSDSSLLTDEDTKVILERQDEKPEIIGDPVVQATPISRDSYVIKSVLEATPDGKGSVSLIATIYLTRDDMQRGYDASVNRYKDEISQTLSAIDGYSAEKYPITYTVQAP